MADEVLRLRATVVSDEALANIRMLGREIGLVQTKGGAGAKQAAAGWASFGKEIKTAGSSMLGLVPGFGIFSAGAAGVGIAAGLMIKSLNDTAKKIVELSYASKALGMSTDALQGWTAAAEKAGVAPEAMMQGLSNFKRNTEDFGMRIGELRGQMVAMGAGPVLARINAATNQLDKMKEAFDFKDVLEESDPSGMKARRFFEMIGLGADTARLSWKEFKEEQAKQPLLSDEDKAAAKEYHAALVDLGNQWDILASKIGRAVLPAASAALKNLNDNIREAARGARVTPDKKNTYELEKEAIQAGKPIPPEELIKMREQERKEFRAQGGFAADESPGGRALEAMGIGETYDQKMRQKILEDARQRGAKGELPQLTPAEPPKPAGAALPAAPPRASAFIPAEVSVPPQLAPAAVAPQPAPVAVEPATPPSAPILPAPWDVPAPVAPPPLAPQPAPVAVEPQIKPRDKVSYRWADGTVHDTPPDGMSDDEARAKVRAAIQPLGQPPAGQPVTAPVAPQLPLPQQAAPRVAPADLDRLLKQGDIKITPEQFRSMGKQSPLGDGFKPATYSPGGGEDAGSKTRIITVGVFDALVQFKAYVESGGAAAGGGGAGLISGGGTPGGASAGAGTGPSGASTGGGGGGGAGTGGGGGGGSGGGGAGGTGEGTGTGTGGTGTGGTGGDGDSTGQNATGDGGQRGSRPGPGGQGTPSGANTGADGASPNGSAVVPGRFKDDVAGMLASGAKPKDVQKYLSSKGVNVSIPTCGQFMAAVVKDHGGTPPPGAATASNWNNFGGREGAGYSDDPNAINVAVKQGVKTGNPNSHVTAAIPIRDKDGKITGFTGVGVNQGRGGVATATGDYGRNIITSNRITIGTGRGQYQIRHQIVKPPEGQQQQTAAVPKGADGQVAAPAGAQTPDASAPNGSSIPKPEGAQGGGAAFLAQQRKPLTDELARNPELKKRLAALTTYENENDATAVTESLYNRTTAINEERAKRGLPPKTLEQMMGGGKKSFYGPVRKGLLDKRMRDLENDPARMKRRMADIDAAASSNLIEGATDQGSGKDPNVAHGGGKVVRHGETYNDFGGGYGHEANRRFRERQQAAIRAANAARTAAKTAPSGAQASPSEKAEKASKAQDRIDTSRIDSAVAPPAATGQVSVNVHSNGTKATADAKTNGELFQKPQIKQHRQMQKTEDAGEPINV